jgi:hypothetical protein
VILSGEFIAELLSFVPSAEAVLGAADLKMMEKEKQL